MCDIGKVIKMVKMCKECSSHEFTCISSDEQQEKCYEEKINKKRTK